MSYLVNRRDFVLVPALASAALARSSKASHDILALRGYYFTFMRMPTYGLPEWKQIIQAVGEDGGQHDPALAGGWFSFEEIPDHLAIQPGPPGPQEHTEGFCSRADRLCPPTGDSNYSGP